MKIKKLVTAIAKLFRDAFRRWLDHKAARWSAAVAFYTLFSLSPVLIITIGVAGMVYSEQAAREEVLKQIENVLGSQATSMISQIMSSMRQTRENLIATIIGVGVLFWGASNVFVSLRDGIHVMWDLKVNPGVGFWGTLLNRSISLAMVLSMGFLLLVSLIINAIINAMNKYIGEKLLLSQPLFNLLDFFVTFIFITLLFSIIFRFLPSAKVRYRDVIPGAVTTSLLFTVIKVLLGYFIGQSSISSYYGAAASIVIILLWFNVSTQILFLGAELTYVYAYRFGKGIRPGKFSVAIKHEYENAEKKEEK